MSELSESIRVAFLAVMVPGMLWVDRRWDQPEGRIPAPIALTVLGVGLGLALMAQDLTGLILWPAFFLGWRAGGVGAGGRQGLDGAGGGRRDRAFGGGAGGPGGAGPPAGLADGLGMAGGARPTRARPDVRPDRRLGAGGCSNLDRPGGIKASGRVERTGDV